MWVPLEKISMSWGRGCAPKYEYFGVVVLEHKSIHKFAKFDFCIWWFIVELCALRELPWIAQIVVEVIWSNFCDNLNSYLVFGNWKTMKRYWLLVTGNFVHRHWGLVTDLYMLIWSHLLLQCCGDNLYLDLYSNHRPLMSLITCLPWRYTSTIRQCFKRTKHNKSFDDKI